ncbi:hypothetical protein Tco_0817570, partial [Tanacetum coccineum]
NMANENVPAPAPTRSDDQILPFAAWVPIRKSNFFWNTLTYEAKTRAYSFQLDETRFVLDANILRETLEITPIDQAHQFMLPPSCDAIMDFVNELGYTEEIHFVSRMAVNNLPRYAVLQMLWGIITSTNVDYAELMWEEFVQAMQTFLVDKANLSTSPQKGKKTKPHVIPYYWFTKLIICHLGRTHNIHQRSVSLFHLAEEDHRHGNLKFIPKGEEDEVFGMQIPKELVMNNIRNAPYYNAYLEMVAKHDQKTTAEEGGKKKSATKADKSKKPATAKQLKMKPVKEKSSKPAPTQNSKVAQEKPLKPSTTMHPKKAPVGGVAIRKPVAEVTLQLPVVEGNGKAITTDEQAALSLLDLHKPKKRNAEIGADTDKVISKGDTEILNFGEWIRFLNFFNDPRIIREQRIAAYKGYRGGRHMEKLGPDVGGLENELYKLVCKVEEDEGHIGVFGVRG